MTLPTLTMEGGLCPCVKVKTCEIHISSVLTVTSVRFRKDFLVVTPLSYHAQIFGNPRQPHAEVLPCNARIVGLRQTSKRPASLEASSIFRLLACNKRTFVQWQR